MRKHVPALLSALLFAGCASWNQPLEDAGDGVYYAESPPDYVYVDYGVASSGYYPWFGPPYLYPMTFHSPYLYLGSRWYHPPFGTVDYWSMDRYAWHRPTVRIPYRGPVHGVPGVRKSGARPIDREPEPGRYAAGEKPQLRSKADGIRRLEPTTRPSAPAHARASSASPVMRAPPAPRSRPARSMRPAPAPRPSMQNTRRDIN